VPSKSGSEPSESQVVTCCDGECYRMWELACSNVLVGFGFDLGGGLPLIFSFIQFFIVSFVLGFIFSLSLSFFFI
jgi:hypothetical protein